MLAFFITALLALAAVSYRWFEKPVMDAVRRAWKRRAKARAGTPVPASPAARG
jgi:peptidoglycan/LPS O-acetylase OafA/YrhL